jgi:hypothetical protein
MDTAIDKAIEAILGEAMVLAEQLNSDPRMADLKRKITALNTLEDLMSRQRTSLGELLDIGVALPRALQSPGW